MTPEKVLEVIGAYRLLFESLEVTPIDYTHDEILDSAEHGLAHCYGMLDQMESFVREGNMEKVWRWLGFIQGVVWAQGVFPLESLKNHNRSDGDATLESVWLQSDVEQAVDRVKKPTSVFPRLESAGLRGAAAVGAAQLRDKTSK